MVNEIKKEFAEIETSITTTTPSGAELERRYFRVKAETIEECERVYKNISEEKENGRRK